jgi:hypothetical protein
MDTSLPKENPAVFFWTDYWINTLIAKAFTRDHEISVFAEEK